MFLEIRYIEKSYPEMYFILNLSEWEKQYRHLKQILAHLTMTIHKERSTDVTAVANFNTFLFSPDFSLNFGESQEIASNLLLYQPKI